MSERRPSRAERRRYAERTGRRPVRERPLRPFEQGSTVDAASQEGSSGAAGMSTVTPSGVRAHELAPASARSVSYLHRRQEQIGKDLRGLAVVWVAIILVFVAIVAYMNFL